MLLKKRKCIILKPLKTDKVFLSVQDIIYVTDSTSNENCRKYTFPDNKFSLKY